MDFRSRQHVKRGFSQFIALRSLYIFHFSQTLLLHKMDKPTPRINSELREKYVGRTVRLTGKIVSVS